ncbi:MAG: metal-dependent transcriptional regulator [Gemmatimonadaceae bacterium]|nr:metal-dependent transcriptional regulator [Gemmatimonadaceae bacterium]
MTPRDQPPELSAPVEDYLKAIYELEQSGAAAGTNELAARLHIAPASVSGMVRRLADQELIAHERYKGARLTDAGRRAALRTIRRHRVIETYLTQALGYPWDLVHDEAERLEHACSDELVDRMAAAIGEPEHDPHGAPIPTREGTVDERRFSSIADLQVGDEALVRRVSDENGERLRYLAELGIVPGVQLTLIDRAPFEGPITVAIGAAHQVIGTSLATEVLVERLSMPIRSPGTPLAPGRRKDARSRRTP